MMGGRLGSAAGPLLASNSECRLFSWALLSHLGSCVGLIVNDFKRRLTAIARQRARRHVLQDLAALPHSEGHKDASCCGYFLNNVQKDQSAIYPISLLSLPSSFFSLPYGAFFGFL